MPRRKTAIFAAPFARFRRATREYCRLIRIAIDAMGGDHGPEVTIQGLQKVVERRPDARFLIFGQEERVRPMLAQHRQVEQASQFTHCEVAVRMDDKPSQALRQGRWKSSMWKAIESIKTGDAGRRNPAFATTGLTATADRRARVGSAARAGTRQR